jgi:6-phosphogluconate dehydrogenase
MKTRFVSMTVGTVLAVTALTGCSSGDDSVAPTSISTNKSQTTIMNDECRLAQSMFADERQRLMESGVSKLYASKMQEVVKQGYISVFARVWPKMTDPDLKSIFRELSKGDFDAFLVESSADFMAYMSICFGK